jgi:hypothetical protein
VTPAGSGRRQGKRPLPRRRRAASARPRPAAARKSRDNREQRDQDQADKTHQQTVVYLGIRKLKHGAA